MFEKIPKRYILCLFAFTGLMFHGIIRSSLAIGIVAMVKSMTKQTNNSSNSTSEETFEWNTKVQGYVLSAFFITYALTQLPVGFLSLKVSAKWLIGIGTFLLGFLNIFVPICARWGPFPLFILRLIQGTASGVFVPTMHTVWSRWAPKQDQALLPTFTFSGVYVGTTLSMFCGGLIATHLSWKWIFYLSGIFTLLWTILWFFFISETPAEHSTITKEELNYIESNLDKPVSEKYSIPWKHIFTSLPVISIAVAHFSVNLTVYFFVNELPIFLTTSLEFSVEKTGVWSAVPWIFFCLSMWFGGFAADKLRKSNRIIFVRKCIVGMSSSLMVFVLFLLIIISLNYPKIIMIYIILILAAAGFNIAGFYSNHLDVAAKYAGILLGLTNGIATVGGIIIPTLTGQIVRDQHLKSQWDIIFIILLGVSLVGACFYLIFASGDLQSWVEHDATENTCILESSSSTTSHNSTISTLKDVDEYK